ncbi:tRNA uridine-5-carboxymethylaminomethyl(34) synthesis enzyme MnmG, partial [Candidatus Poribacteria bacterium]
QELPWQVKEQVEIQIKYEGYIKRQEQQIKQFKKMEGMLIPPDFDYSKVKGISNEAREKLMKIRPRSIGQASRISGVSPADIAVLMVALKAWKEEREAV